MSRTVAIRLSNEEYLFFQKAAGDIPLSRWFRIAATRQVLVQSVLDSLKVERDVSETLKEGR